jgi:MOSC domain-containing protein YiiM
VSDPRVASILVGKVAPLGVEGVQSGFVKHATSGPVRVSPLGILGDEQADLRVHGGPDKAVYGYGSSHYAKWRDEYPQHSNLLVPGGLGENLAIEDMTEADLCVGDIHGIGTARLQVCQPRQPCFKFALRFDDVNMPKAMIRNGRSGWYYRVLVPGVISQGDRIVLLERLNARFPFTRLVELATPGKATSADWQQLRDMPGLALNWKHRAAAILARQPRDEGGGG